jgi:hypothetical protein
MNVWPVVRWSVPALVLALPALGGCVWVEDAKFKGERTQSVAHVEGSAISVTAGNGSVNVKRRGEKDVQITAKIRATTQERLDGVKIHATRDAGGVLQVKAEWPGGKSQSGEGVSFVIETPGQVGVTVTTSNGSIELADQAGAATLKTSNGSITVASHGGAVVAETSNGAVKVGGVAGAVTIVTSNGAVDATLPDENPGPANITTSNGSISLSVGPKFAGTVTGKTSNGRVSMPGAPANAKSASVKLGEGPESTLKSSNGSITFEQRR